MSEIYKNVPFPNYNLPPVIEVVMGVQFTTSAPFTTIDFMDLWLAFGRDNYPLFQEMPPLEDINVSNETKQFRIEVVMGPELPRYWFMSKAEDALIQVQKNRLLYNWRLPYGGDPQKYPRYSAVKEIFFKHHKVFHDFIKSKQWPTMTPAFTEIVYVNHIDMPKHGVSNLGSVFKDVKLLSGSPLLDRPNVLNHMVGFAGPLELMRSQIQIGTAVNLQTAEEAMRCELGVYGALKDRSETGVATNFDAGREWIVKTFDSITTPEMHRKWGKQ